MDHILYHLPYFASPNNDAIGGASKFPIFKINEDHDLYMTSLALFPTEN